MKCLFSLDFSQPTAENLITGTQEAKNANMPIGSILGR
jgi:hypothetical protein